MNPNERNPNNRQFKTVGAGDKKVTPAQPVASPPVEQVAQTAQADTEITAASAEAAGDVIQEPIPPPVETEIPVDQTERRAAPEPAMDLFTDPIQAIVMGKAALVPLDFLKGLMTPEQISRVRGRRRTRRARAAVTAAQRPAKAAKVPKVATGITDKRRMKPSGVYTLSSKSPKTVRGRKTIKRVYDYFKKHPSGVTAKQVAVDLKMPTSTVQYTLTRLLEKQAVNYRRA
jgi:hypothetical protein